MDETDETMEVEVQRGHLLHYSGKTWKLHSETKTADGTVLSQTFAVVEPEAYHQRIDDLALRISLHAEVKLEDVVSDALFDYPLARIQQIEVALAEQEREAAPKVGTYRSHCTELLIGEERVVLRE